MLKNSVSIAIIIIAIVIVFWNLNEASEKKETVSSLALAKENTITPEDEMEVEEIETPEQTMAPNFTLETLDGQKLALSDFKGQKVLVNFWASWCPPCQTEMPHIQNFYEKNKNNRIAVLAVNLTSEDNRSKLAPFIEEYGLTFPILLDVTGDIGEQYEIITIPTSYFIDEHGAIVQKIVGPMDEEMMENIMNSF